jgi:8-oxo-dGTP pyrophosphatase MutT (NUDIX family)
MAGHVMVRTRKQIAALPWRRKKGGLEVLLVTSRETKRWVIPKGWPMDHLVDSNAARREAYEEAGVEGHVTRDAMGAFDYVKILRDGSAQPCRVKVYALEVTELLRRWPEKNERKRQWFSVDDAAWNVDEPGLKEIIRTLA